MANTLRFKRGLVSGIPTAALGEPLFTTDTFDLYIGNGTGNTRFQKYIASGTTSQLLRGDGSLLTMPIVLTSPSNGQVLKFNGTNWVNDSDAGITGSGAAGQVAFFTGATTQSGSNNLFWDSANSRLGVGTNVPSGALDVRGGTNSQIRTTDGTIVAKVQAVTSLAAYIGTETNHETRIITNNSPRITIFGGGNVAVGGTGDNGLRFQVTGDGYFSGSVGIGSSALAVASLRISKNITGGPAAFGINNEGIVQSDVTANAINYRSVMRTVATAFTLFSYEHFSAIETTLGAGSAVTNQTGFGVGALTQGTNIFGFVGGIAAGTGRWNLYMNGTAANYLNGSLSIGTTSTSQKVNIVGSILSTVGYVLNRSDNYGFFTGASDDLGIYHDGTNSFISNATGALIFNNPTERMRLDASGNLGLGVTPSAWGSNFRVLQLANLSTNGSAALWEVSNVAGFSNNLYNDGTNRYRTNNFATIFQHWNGQFAWLTAPSGTAGNAITFTQAMTLDASGNLLVGSTSAGGSTTPVNISLGSAFGTNTAGSTANLKLRLYDDGVNTNHYGFGVSSNLMEVSFPSSIAFFNGASASRTERMRINASGRVLIGSSSDSGETFQLTGTMRVSGAATFSSSVTAANLYSTGASNFATSNGNVGIGTVSPGYKLHVQTSGASGTSFGLRVQAGTNSSDATMQILSQAGSTYLFLRGDNNLGFGTSLVGATGTNTMSVFSGTAPTTNVTDSFQMYSNDVTAGNAAPHFRTENGAVIKLYQQDNSIAAANFVAGIGTSVTTLDAFDGYTIGQVVKALRNAGILS